MDITKIRLVGLQTVDLPISVARPGDPFIAKNVDGLGPPGFDVSIAPSTVQGGFYQGRQAINRELVFHIGLNPNFRVGQTASSLREWLYGLVVNEQPDESTLVQFMFNDVVIATTKGYASKIEPIYFAEEPEVQLTFPCDWPYLQAPFVKPYTLTTKNLFDVPNIGSASSGFEMSVEFTAPVDNWTLYQGFKKISFFFPFKAGDILSFNTLPGSRTATVSRGGVLIDMLYTISADSQWLMLRGGTNSFRTSSQGFTHRFFRYRPQFLGV